MKHLCLYNEDSHEIKYPSVIDADEPSPDGKGKLWEYDKNKVDIIINNGYNLEVVWETDYKTDKTIINKLIKKYDRK